MKPLNLAAGVFVILALLGLAYGASIASRHGLDRSWPSQARYHVVVSGIHLIALSLVTAVTAIGGLRRRRRAAWITLLIVSTVAGAAWPIARAIAGQAPPGWVQAVTLGGLLAALVALAISFRPIFDLDGPTSGRPSAPPVGE